MTKKIVALAGDGIGPEIMEAGLEVLEALAKKTGFVYEIDKRPFGGAGIDAAGHPLPDETLKVCREADAILLAAIGSPQYDSETVRPEQGLLALRKELNLYANIRPVKIFDSLKHLSPLKSERIAGVDFVVVRELTGGIYFGDHILEERKARDINDYSYEEVEQIIRKAFEIARNRRKIVTSIDKQNVLATSKLWRKVAEEVAQDFPDVTLEHQLVDSAAMLMITNPAKFDVIVTENLFGDILSDESSVLSGTLGVMPSASHSENGPSLYEPIHGSAPDIAGQGIANPISMILSVAMMLRDSFGRYEDAERIERAVEASLAAGILTRDLGGQASTKEMTEAIIARL
ncbi:3-isopropylmalate dehydrogenase [Streptococcus pneumoniae]|uniref:3-isopropylmalate dehydrogenase n=1 Tax=Streptococcus pneumoniae TaxID=1313 RepID=UPI0005DFADFE|nr:3-isopropylmalate dehydrogenase [Streptococcus pneumoniae]CJJ54711.1 3-isopropylmalate dehydrogenase [Streptococcus pneumoniae]CJP28473.1 3-isopropylmalate dehydrogenase [Streptococcus pneumoniae]CJS15855.1 3-isopropylmalate dehydrogenase [Streptococcus pneumoniae]CJX13499.1 3-isopropylmalate dehydrogenase [Streptococcus pneumoniae]CJZ65244.1 3-isopropylmalate dehydrogenase [Streptococcus pneumoniae]